MEEQYYFFSATILGKGIFAQIREITGTFKQIPKGLGIVDGLESTLKEKYPGKNVEITSLGRL